MSHEYRVVPAPRRAGKMRGARGEGVRFARTLEDEINRQAAEGWDYVRTDSLPEEKRGWFGGSTVIQRTLLVFRRERMAAALAPAMPDPLPAAAAPVGAPPPPAHPYSRPLAPRPPPRAERLAEAPRALAEPPAPVEPRAPAPEPRTAPHARAFPHLRPEPEPAAEPARPVADLRPRGVPPPPRRPGLAGPGGRDPIESLLAMKESRAAERAEVPPPRPVPLEEPQAPTWAPGDPWPDDDAPRPPRP